MPEISIEQATIVENCLVKVQDLIAEAPEDVKQMLLEAEQIMSGVIDSAKEGEGGSNPFGDQGGPK